MAGRGVNGRERTGCREAAVMKAAVESGGLFALSSEP